MAVVTHGGTLPNSSNKTDFYAIIDNSTVTGIVNADISAAAAIADSKLAQITTAGKVSGAALTTLANIPSGAGVVPVANLGSGTPTAATTLLGDGSWATGPAGSVVQVVNTTTGAVATGTTVMPGRDDDTIPQITEGDEYMTLAITPKSLTNKLKVDVVWYGNNSSSGSLTVALFNTDVHLTNAIGAGIQNIDNIVNDPTPIVFTCYLTAPVITATTFRVRAGGNAGATTTTFNGHAGGRNLGGVLASSITITEIKA